MPSVAKVASSIVLMVSLHSVSSLFIFGAHSLGAGYFDGFPLHCEAFSWDVRTSSVYWRNWQLPGQQLAAPWPADRYCQQIHSWQYILDRRTQPYELFLGLNLNPTTDRLGGKNLGIFCNEGVCVHDQPFFSQYVSSSSYTLPGTWYIPYTEQKSRAARASVLYPSVEGGTGTGGIGDRGGVGGEGRGDISQHVTASTQKKKTRVRSFTRIEIKKLRQLCVRYTHRTQTPKAKNYNETKKSTKQ